MNEEARKNLELLILMIIRDDEFKNKREEMAKKITEIADIVFISGFKKGYKQGMTRHTWMKEGKTYVGNGTYTLRESLKSAENEGLIENSDY
jgi:hypothetical protein